MEKMNNTFMDQINTRKNPVSTIIDCCQQHIRQWPNQHLHTISNMKYSSKWLETLKKKTPDSVKTS